MSARLKEADLIRLGASLSQREREVVLTIARLRLATHAQCARLLSLAEPDASAARAARRVLARLHAAGVLARLQRRIGGVRAGASGYCYYLGPGGQRLVAYWQGHGLVRGRFRPEPGGRYVRHRLAVSELFVQARLRAAEGDLDLLDFDVEPDCWRSYLDGFGSSLLLKPDAFVRLGVGAYEDRFFVEVDLASESKNVVARKLRSYVDYFHAGHEQAKHGVFPRVLWLTTTEARRAALIETCSRLPAEAWHLFAVAGLDQAVEIMRGEVKP